MDEFQQKIKQWVELDIELKKENEKIKILRNTKNELNNRIIQYAKTNNLMKAKIEINDSVLKFVNTKTTSTITLKYLEKCLQDIIDDNSKIDKIMSYIKNNRETTVTTEIKFS